MAIWYIDPINGRTENDGLSPDTPKKEDTWLPSPGDTVLYKRGTVIRAEFPITPGTPDAPITYGAYGDGPKPVFCSSLDASSPQDWEPLGENIWRFRRKKNGDVGNIIFVRRTDDDRPWNALAAHEQNSLLDGATLRWERGDLCAQGDFWDSRFGEGERRNTAAEPELLLYSVDNPADVYAHIELAHYNHRHIGQMKANIIIEDLEFFGSGVHALAGSAADNVTVRRCTFRMIGGCVWNRELRIRFGNAVEFWESGNDILIEDNDFFGIYDSCVTHQGPGERTVPARNCICRRNTFNTYGMAAFEYRDKMMIDSEFTDNLCINAGCGFAMYGEDLPRRSEIWPQPMGHHIFLWRIYGPTEGGSLVIARNYFESAPNGAAIYSIISPEAEAQMAVFGNTYNTDNPDLLCHVGGISYNNMHKYTIATGWDLDDDPDQAQTWIAGTHS